MCVYTSTPYRRWLINHNKYSEKKNWFQRGLFKAKIITTWEVSKCSWLCWRCEYCPCSLYRAGMFPMNTGRVWKCHTDWHSGERRIEKNAFCLLFTFNDNKRNDFKNVFAVYCRTGTDIWRGNGRKGFAATFIRLSLRAYTRLWKRSVWMTYSTWSLHREYSRPFWRPSPIIDSTNGAITANGLCLWSFRHGFGSTPVVERWQILLKRRWRPLRSVISHGEKVKVRIDFLPKTCWPKNFSDFVAESSTFLWYVALVCFVRPTAAITWLPLCFHHLRTSRLSVVRNVFLKYLPIGVIVGGASVGIDYLGHGSFVLTPLEFLKVNVLNEIGSFYGTTPW